MAAGNVGIAALNSTDVAWADSTADEIRTYRFNGSTWSQVGSGLSIAGTTLGVNLAAMSSTRIALSTDGSDTMQAYDWNGSTWSAVGSSVSITGTGAFTITALNSTDVATNRGGGVYRFNGSSWTSIGTLPGGGSYSSLAALSNGAIAASSTTEIVTYSWSGAKGTISQYSFANSVTGNAICALGKYAIAQATNSGITYFELTSMSNIFPIAYGPVIFR
jgi:hypothetical protein